MRNEDVQFLRSGLRYFPEAQQTIAHFKDLVVAALARGLARWPAVKRHSRGSGKGSDELYVQVSQFVTLAGEQAEVSVGLAWEAREPYLYVYCGNGPEWARHPTGAGFENDDAYNLLSRTIVAENLDFEAEIDQILKEWESALHPPPATAG